MQTHCRTFVGVIIGIAALIVGSAANAQTTEPIVGTWKLDTAKSTYKPGPAPQSSTLIVEPAGKGLKVAVDAVNAAAISADGKMMTVTSTGTDAKGQAIHNVAIYRK